MSETVHRLSKYSVMVGFAITLVNLIMAVFVTTQLHSMKALRTPEARLEEANFQIAGVLLTHHHKGTEPTYEEIIGLARYGLDKYEAAKELSLPAQAHDGINLVMSSTLRLYNEDKVSLFTKVD